MIRMRPRIDPRSMSHRGALSSTMHVFRPAAVALLVGACSAPATPPSPGHGPVPSTETTSLTPTSTATSHRPRPPTSHAPPPSDPGPRPSGRLDVLAAIPANGAVLIGPRVIILSPDFGSALAADVTTGDEIWRVALPGHPSGQHILQRLDERPLLRRDDDLILLDAATGRTVAHHRGPMGDRRFVNRRAGMCMLNGSCSAQIIDCGNARPLGPAVDGVRIFRHSLGTDGHPLGPGVDSCAGFAVQLLGRAGDLLVYSGHGLRRPPPAPGALIRPMFSGSSVLAAVRADSGEVVWEHEDRGCGLCSDSLIGIGMDGRLGWVVRDGTLDVFATRTGKSRWTRKFDDGVVGAIWFDGPVSGLFVTTEREVAAYAPSGRQRFRRPRGDLGTLPMLRTAILPELAHLHFVREHETVAWLDPTTGNVLETVVLEGKTLLSDDAGHPVIAGHDDKRDAAGQVIEGMALLDVERERRPESGHGPPNHATVRELDSGAPLMHIDQDAWSLGEWSDSDGLQRFAAIYVHRPDEPGEVRIVRFTRSARDAAEP